MGETNGVSIGDSIRMAYQPVVDRLLEEDMNVWGPEGNGGDSRNVLENLESWVFERPCDVLHLNCGLHDLRLREGEYQVPLEEYVRNVHRIMDALIDRFEGEVIWATTTPVIDERHQRVKNFQRREQDVKRYNSAGLAVTKSHNLRVNDLHALVQESGPRRLLSDDGVHFKEEGNRLLGEAVASCVCEDRIGDDARTAGNL